MRIARLPKVGFQGTCSSGGLSACESPRCPAARQRDAVPGERGSLARRQALGPWLPHVVRLALAGHGPGRGARAARAAARAGAFDAVVCWHHARGGEGAADLGRALAAACAQPAEFRFLYPLELSIKARTGLFLCVGYAALNLRCPHPLNPTRPGAFQRLRLCCRPAMRACACMQPPSASPAAAGPRPAVALCLQCQPVLAMRRALPA